jgi:hypothetical protein
MELYAEEEDSINFAHLANSIARWEDLREFCVIGA